MLTYELLEKLENYLKSKGLNYEFNSYNYEDKSFFSGRTWTDKYVSWNLLILTDIIKNNILNSDGSQSPIYNIELINKITKLLYESGDEDLKNIAWNTFFDLSDDERFILHEEMNSAFNKWLFEPRVTNHTDKLETPNLIIKANNKEDSKKLKAYIDKYDSENKRPYYRMIRDYDANTNLCFNLFLKSSNKIIGFIVLYFEKYPNEEKAYLDFYLKKKYQNKIDYLKEALTEIIKALNERKVMFYCYKHKRYVLEEWIPNIKVLFIEDVNSASGEVAKATGFEFIGTNSIFVLDEKYDGFLHEICDIYALKLKD